MVKLAQLTLIFLHIRVSLQQRRSEGMADLPAECFTAKLIKDNTRIFHKHMEPTLTYTDLNIQKGWYRFSGTPEIPANSLQEGFPGPLRNAQASAPNFCGTTYPGTLMGSHPGINEGIVPFIVCFKKRYCYYLSIQGCECKSKRLIYARNCIRHYIYWLVPTASDERYCTGIAPLVHSNTTQPIECTQHKILNDPKRVWDTLSLISSETEEGWIQFGEQSGYEIASECSIKNESRTRTKQPCGARYRGWLKDSHPSVQEGRVDRRVCFSYNDNCACAFYSRIKVRNCGTFYVYHFEKPPFSEAKYCGIQSMTNDAMKPRFKPINICNISRTIQNSDRLWSNTSPVLLKCDSDLYGVYRFVVFNRLPLQIVEGCNKTDTLIKQHRCAAEYQGFMEGGVNPTVSEGYVQRIICFQSKETPCECDFTAVIGVQNCGESYAYDLQGVPRCNARYCMTVGGDPSVSVASLDEPVYDIKPVTKQFLKVESDTSGILWKIDWKDPFTVILTLLAIILLILCLLFVLLLIWVCHIVRPLYIRKKTL